MSKSDDIWWASVETTLAVGQKLYGTLDEFNSACEHVVRLLKDASIVLSDGSHGTASFLAITALEETAKIHLGMYRKSEEPVARGKDPLYRHVEKHRLAAAPTVAMGSRLQAAIGEARMHELVELARGGGLVRLREASLYVEPHETALRSPAQIFTAKAARELLLFAAEAFDDALVGYTSHSMSLSTVTDAIFSKWAQPNYRFKGRRPRLRRGRALNLSVRFME